MLNEVKTNIKDYNSLTKDIREHTFFGKLKDALVNDLPSEYNDEFQEELTKGLDKFNVEIRKEFAELRKEVQVILNEQNENM